MGALKYGSNSIRISFVSDALGAFDIMPEIAAPAKTIALASAAIAYGATAPNALIVTVLDQDGFDLLRSAASALTSAQRIAINPPAVFVGPISVVLTGNTAVAAEVTITLFFI